MNLDQYIIEEKTIPPQKCFEIFRKILKAYNSLFKAKIIHGGLCPEAILFDKDGKVKIGHLDHLLTFRTHCALGVGFWERFSENSDIFLSQI